MFSGCKSLTSLNLSNFNTESTTDMSGMFNDCENLEILDISYFNLEKCEFLNNMFSNVDKLKYLYIKNITTNKIIYDNFKNTKLLFLIIIPTTILTSETLIPNTIQTSIQTTIFTTIPSTIILSTISNTNSYTINNTIPSTIPSTIPNTIYSTIPSTFPTRISSKIPSTIPSTIYTTVTTKVIHTSIISTVPTLSTTIPSTVATKLPKSTSVYTTIPKTILPNILTTLINTIPSNLIKNTSITQGFKTTEITEIINYQTSNVIGETEQTEKITYTPIPTTIIKEEISSISKTSKAESMTTEKIFGTTNTKTSNKIIVTEKINEITEKITDIPTSKNAEPISTNQIKTTEKKETTQLIKEPSTNLETQMPEISNVNSAIVFLGLSHFSSNNISFSFNLYLAPIRNFIYSGLLRFPVSIFYKTDIKLKKETEANCNKQNNLLISHYKYLCEVHEDTKNISQIRIEPKFDFVTHKNVTLVGITPFAKEFMNNVEYADDKYDILSNNTIFILYNSTYIKYDELFFNISGSFIGPKPKLSKTNLTLYINIESETKSNEEIQCHATNNPFADYSLKCTANETFKGDLQSAVTFVDNNNILLLNFETINQSIINIEKSNETNRMYGKFFFLKNSGDLKPGLIAIIVIIPIAVIAIIIFLIVYKKNKSKETIINPDDSKIKKLNLSN